jgi:transcription-repair coupling factor (superfamily II helicase)
MERIQVLSALANHKPSAEPPLITASAPALIQKVAAYSDFASAGHTIKLGMSVEPISLLGRWQAIGYRLENIVEMPGTMSRRGGIVDIYPPTSELPVRLEFFGNTIDSIRLFDPASQRSLTAVASVDISPAKELPASSPHPNKDSILDYLPQQALLILDEPVRIRQAMESLDAEAGQQYIARQYR